MPPVDPSDNQSKPGVSLAFPMVPIRLTDKAMTPAAIVAVEKGGKLVLVIKERLEASAPGPAQLGKVLVSITSDDVINIEDDVEWNARRSVAETLPKGTPTPREMVVSFFGQLTTSSAAEPAPLPSNFASPDALQYLTYLQPNSKTADVRYLRFVVDLPAAFPGLPAEAAKSIIAGSSSEGSAKAEGPSDTSPVNAALKGYTQLRDDVMRRVYSSGPRSIVAFVSPISGKGQAEKMWHTEVQPILRCSRHSVVTVITTHKGHAEERAFGGDLFDRSLYVAVGGDGMAHEVVNGIMRRRSERPDSIPESLLLGIVPAGSGCGIAKNLDVIDPIAAAMALVHCRQAPLDLMRSRFLDTTKYEKVDPKAKDKKARAEEREVEVKAAHHPERYGFLSCSFAITNEIDRGSEKYRWMGNARFTFAAVKILAGTIPTYRVSVRYVPWVDPSEASPLKDGKLEKVKAESETPTFRECTFRDDCPQCRDRSKETTTTFSDEDWVNIEEEQFAFLMVCNVPWIGRDANAAPHAHLSDGAMDLVFIPPDKQKDGTYAVSRSRFVKVFLELEEGKQVPNPEYRYVKAKAIEILPRDGITMMDGEAVPTDGEDLAGMRLDLVPHGVTFVRGR